MHIDPDQCANPLLQPEGLLSVHEPTTVVLAAHRPFMSVLPPWSFNFLLHKMVIIIGATSFGYSIVEEYMGGIQEVLNKQKLLLSESYFIEVEEENKP